MSVFMQPIYTQTVGSGGAASITFNNIPQGFTDIKVVISARSSYSGGTLDYAYIAPNGSYANQAMTRLQGNGATVASQHYYGAMYVAIPAGTATSNTFGNTEIYISNYSNGSYKQIIWDSIQENNNVTAYQEINSGLWEFTNPITSLTISMGGTNLVQYSTFTLYGVAEQYSTQTPVAPTIGAVTDQAGFAAVAFTPTTPDQAVTYAVTDNSSNTTYGASSPIVAPVTLGTSTTFTAKAINSLGTASSATSSAVTSANSYASIATLIGATSNGMFTNIPQNYTHLQMRVICRTDRSATDDYFVVRPNGDAAGSNYYYHILTGNGSTTSVSSSNASVGRMGWVPAASAPANVFGVLIIDILDYANTTKYKTGRSIGGWDGNGSGETAISSWFYPSFSPITSILFGGDIGNPVAGSSFALYGIA
jgi:hypothetical protein